MATRIHITSTQYRILQNKLIAYMYEQKLTPTEMSHQCWLSDGMVSQIIRGICMPSDATIRHIARAMDITVYALLSIPAQPPEEPQIVWCSEDGSQPTTHTQDAWKDIGHGIELPSDSAATKASSWPQDEPGDVVHQDASPIGDNTTETFLGTCSGPYMIMSIEDGHTSRGINLSHVKWWQDDRHEAMLTLTYADGTNNILSGAQRTIVLQHLAKLSRATIS